MPTYEYRCVSCEHQFERFQRMSDEPVKECEVCGEPVKRLLFPVAIQFKGSGFYTTDYARKSALASSGSKTETAGEPSSKETSGAETSGSGESGSTDKASGEPSASATPEKKPVTSVAGSKA